MPDAEVTPITKASQTRKSPKTEAPARAELLPKTKRTRKTVTGAPKTTAAKKRAAMHRSEKLMSKAASKTPAKKAAAKAKVPAVIAQLDGMKAALAVAKEQGLSEPGTDKCLKITEGNWRAIVDGTYDPANPPPEPVAAKKGDIASLPTVGKEPKGTAHQQVNRRTRARIFLVDLGEKPRWKLVCGAHDTEATTGDRAVANYGMTYTWGWCTGCRELVGPNEEVKLPYKDQPERALNSL